MLRQQTLVILFALSGLVSGFITDTLMYPTHQEAGLSCGVVFGFFLILCLSAPYFVESPYKTIVKAVVMIAVSTGTYVLSYFVTVGLQMRFPAMVPSAERWSMGTNEPASAAALFVGGRIGGLLVFSAALLLFGPSIRRSNIVRNILVGTAIGGSLGVAGWALRSSVGVAVWHILHQFSFDP